MNLAKSIQSCVKNTSSTIFWIVSQYYSRSPADLTGLLPSNIADSQGAKVGIDVNFGAIRIFSFHLFISTG